jgi:hypothetical protein
MSVPEGQIKRRRLSLSFPEEVAPPRPPNFEPGQHLDSDPTAVPRSDGQPRRYDDDPTAPVRREDLPPPYVGEVSRALRVPMLMKLQSAACACSTSANGLSGRSSTKSS